MQAQKQNDKDPRERRSWSEWYRIALGHGHEPVEAVHYANVHYIGRRSTEPPRAA